MEHFGKYHLIRKLATGGMAEVFLAKSAGPMGFEKILVVKRILPHLAEDPRFVQMFLAEARLAARLDHPNVVQIFDLGEHEGGYFLAMEYIDGPSLRTLCRKTEKSLLTLPPAFCARLISMACDGLAYAHDFRDPETGRWLGIIHRDISPENLLLSRSGTLKVVDFGLAKAAAVSETRSHVLFGKYWYMAPEQIRRKGGLDRRVDVYALGVVLYELLTGKKPFDAAGEVEIMRAILADEIVPASRRRPDLPPEIDRILERALGSREERYPTCQEFQAELEDFILQSGGALGSQQFTRLIQELGLFPAGSSGLHIPPTPAPIEGSPPREQLQAAHGRKAGGHEPPGERAPLPSGPGVGKTRVTTVETSADPMDQTILDRELPHMPEPSAPMPEPSAPMSEPSAPVPEPSAPRIEKSGPAIDTANLDRPHRSWVALGMIALGVAVLTAALAIVITPGGPTPPPPAAKPAAVPSPPPPARSATSAPPAPSSPELATVRITSDPPVEVRVNGVLLGRSPVDLLDQSPGEIRIELSERKLGLRKQAWMELKAGNNGVKAFSIVRLPVELRIIPRAHVKVDEQDLGEITVTRLELFEGWHRIQLQNRELHKNVTHSFIVIPDQSNVFRYDLRR